MALTSSGEISLGGTTAGRSVNLELAQAAGATISLNDTNLRSLFGVASSTISLSQGYGKSSYPAYSYNSTHGYFAGGAANPVNVTFAQIDGIVFSTNTAIDPAVSLSDGGLNGLGGVGFSNPSNGYLLGTASSKKLNFSSLAISLVAATLSSSGNKQSSCTSGRTSFSSKYSSTSQVWEKWSMVSETNVGSTAAVAQSRSSAGSTNSQTRGYLAGGELIVPGTMNNLTQIDGIIFDTEAYIDPAAGLSQGRIAIQGNASSSTRGYFIGGAVRSPPSFPGNSREIDGIIFSTETTINPAAALAQARGGFAQVMSATSGYFAGGAADPANVPFNQIDGLTFSTEAAVDYAAALVQTRSRLAGLQNASNN